MFDIIPYSLVAIGGQLQTELAEGYSVRLNCYPHGTTYPRAKS